MEMLNFFFITAIVLATVLNTCVTGESCFEMDSDTLKQLLQKMKDCGGYTEKQEDEEKWMETYKCFLRKEQVVQGDEVDIAKFKEFETRYVKKEENKSLIIKAMDECSGGAEKMDFKKFNDCFEKEEDKICPDDAA